MVLWYCGSMTFLSLKNVESSVNSTTSILTGGGLVYTGTWEDVLVYKSISLVVQSNVDSIIGGIEVQWSTDGSTLSRTIVFSYTASGEITETVDRVSRYVRIKYTSSAEQSSFVLKMYKDTNAPSNSVRPQTVQLDDMAYDAFRRIRVSHPFTLFQNTHIHGENTENMTKRTVTGGSTSEPSNEASLRMSVTTADNAKVTYQSREYIPYQPGKSMSIIITAVLNSGDNETQTESRVGLFDDNNGVFFQYNGTWTINLRSQTMTDISIASSAWNIDRMDGGGVSGVTLNALNAQIFAMDLEWLGVGRVRFGIVDRGRIWPCHEILNANRRTSAYMSRATLPVRYEIENNGVASSAGSMDAICGQVSSEGGFEDLGIPHAIGSNKTDPPQIGNTLEPILAIRMKSAYNHAHAEIYSVHLFSTTNANMMYEVWHFHGTESFDPVSALTSEPAWTSVSSSSIVEYVHGTETNGMGVVTTNGVLRWCGFISNNSDYTVTKSDRTIQLNVDVHDQSDIVVVCAVKLGAGTEDMYASFEWTEIRN